MINFTSNVVLLLCALIDVYTFIFLRNLLVSFKSFVVVDSFWT